MTDYYVAATGSNTAPYDTWAKAATSATTVFALVQGGDRVWVDQAFQQTGMAGTQTIGDGTASTTPVLIAAVDRTGDPEPPLSSDLRTSAPTTYNFQASVDFYFYARDLPVHFHGIGFHATSIRRLVLAGTSNTQSAILCDLCFFKFDLYLVLGILDARGNWKLVLRDCVYEKSHNSYGGFFVHAGRDPALIEGGSVSGSSLLGTVPAIVEAESTSFVAPASLVIRGLDLNDALDWSGVALLQATAATNRSFGRVIFERCNLPTGMSALTSSALPSPAAFVKQFASPIGGSGANDFNLVEEHHFGGRIVTDKTIYRTNGATDGTSSFSFKVESNAQPSHVNPLEITLHGFFGESGASKTLTVHFLHDSVTDLQDDELWMTVSYGGVASSSAMAFERGAPAVVGHTPANHASSAEGWTDLLTAITSPRTQKLSATITPQSKGPFTVSIFVVKPSYALWIDPKVEVA